MKHFQKLSFCILFSLFLIQCSDHSKSKSRHIRILNEIPPLIQDLENLTVFSGDQQPMYSVTLIPEMIFGETEEHYLTTIIDCIVDEKGRVTVWDSDYLSREYPFQNRLYVYNADGTYHSQIGGPGRGPGEFGMLIGVQIKAGKVFVLDHTNQRLNIYSAIDYSYKKSSLIGRWGIKDQESAKNLELGDFKARSDGNILMTFYAPISDKGRSEYKYLLMDDKGTMLDYRPLVFSSTLKVTKANSIVPSSLLWLPFMGSNLTALSDKDALYVVWTQDFLIKKYDAQGVYQSAIYYPVIGSSFDLNEYTSTSRYNQRDVTNTLKKANEELPEANPVIADLFVDDENKIWVAVPMGVESGKYEWWILKETGELLAKLVLPRDQPIYDIKNGYLYSKKTNKETGAEYVIKYKIEFTER